MSIPIYETVLGFVRGIFEPVIELIDDLHLSVEEKANLANKLELAQLQVVEKQVEAKAREAEAEARAVEAQARVLTIEAAGKSWLQRNWRPGLMALIILLIFNNFLLVPYLSVVWPAIKATPIPVALWAVLGSACGVYTFGRSWEKKK